MSGVRASRDDILTGDRRGLLRTLAWKAGRFVPARYQLPLRFHYRRWFGGVDRELPLLKTLVGNAQTAVDVGANVGVYTYALWRLCRQVEAFEPVAEVASVIRAFGASNIRVHEVALSSAAGSGRLYFPRVGEVIGGALGSLSPVDETGDWIDVPVRTLDGYGFTDVSFIKIDVEGHELDVLNGAAETVKRCRPNLLVEIEQRHLSVPMSAVFDYIAGFGYRGFFLAGRTLHPLSEFRYEQHQQPFLKDLYGGQYVNNFVFTM